MQALHGGLAGPPRRPPLDAGTPRAYLTRRGDHGDPKDRMMLQQTPQTDRLDARGWQTEADAVLAQMFGYFTRDCTRDWAPAAVAADIRRAA